jgi:hypothetical protein
LIVLIIVIGLASRLYLAYAYPGNFDQEMYEVDAQIMRAGGNIYAEQPHYNYSPVWAYCLLFLSRLADASHLSLHFVVRGFLSLVDGINALLIWRLASRRAALVYWLNPVAILIVGYHGQFETFAMVPLLLATLRARASKLSAGQLIALGAASLLIKHITVFFVWMLSVHVLGWKRATLAMVAMVGIFGLSFLPFVPAGNEGILHNVLLYTSVRRLYSPFHLLPSPIAVGLFLGVMMALPLATFRRSDILTSVELATVAFVVFTPGMALQYLLLPAMVGSFHQRSLYWGFTAIVTGALCLSPDNIGLVLQIG